MEREVDLSEQGNKKIRIIGSCGHQIKGVLDPVKLKSGETALLCEGCLAKYKADGLLVE